MAKCLKSENDANLICGPQVKSGVPRGLPWEFLPGDKVTVGNGPASQAELRVDL